jgi:hypothetical protein
MRACFGCRIPPASKLKTRQLCKIKNCSYLKRTNSKFCYECEIFPCNRLKNIDKRYRTRYKTSFIENLQLIRDKGMVNFLAFETDRRTCSNCGAILSVHREYCLQCGKN